MLYEFRAALPAAAGVPRAIRVCICASATSPRRGPSPPCAVCIVKRKGHPLSDEDDSTLQDLLANPLSPYEGTEQAIWNAQARTALDSALDTIPEQCAKTIRALYFESSTETAVAASRGVSIEAIHQQKVRGLQYLRARAEYLNEYSNLNPYSRNTLASYNRTGSSGPELVAMRNEYRLRKLKASIYHPENAQK